MREWLEGRTGSGEPGELKRIPVLDA